MRKWTETIKPWPSLKTGFFYKTEVVEIKKVQRQIKITAKILNQQMLDRTVSFLLDLPIRPDGITADFFKACHIPLSVGAKISPNDTIGKKLLIRFDENQEKITALNFKVDKQQPHLEKENYHG